MDSPSYKSEVVTLGNLLIRKNCTIRSLSAYRGQEGLLILWDYPGRAVGTRDPDVYLVEMVACYGPLVLVRPLANQGSPGRANQGSPGKKRLLPVHQMELSPFDYGHLCRVRGKDMLDYEMENSEMQASAANDENAANRKPHAGSTTKMVQRG